jgi:hypothetical protein
MDTWKAAQAFGAEHATSRDTDEAGPNPAGRIYPYRGRVRCRDCKRRMTANPFPSHVYYRCPHKPDNPRHQAAAPSHPRTVQAPETVLDHIAGQFFRDRIFTPARTAQLPASETEAAARRDQTAAALTAQIRKLDAQQAAQIRALEDIPDGPAAKAMSARISERFTPLHTERAAAETKLAALTTEHPKAADPAILDEIPYAGDIIPDLPPALKARLFAAFDLNILWNKTSNQATVTATITDATLTATITDATLTAVPGILDPSQDGNHDTASPDAPAANVGVLARSPIATPNAHPRTSVAAIAGL